MTTAKGFSVSLLIAAIALLHQSAMAADQIHQRASDSGSVELSNLDDSDASAPVANIDKPTNITSIQTTAIAPPVKPVSAKRAKSKNANSSEETENADANADESTQAADTPEAATDGVKASANAEAPLVQHDMPATAIGSGFSGGGYTGAPSSAGNSAVSTTGSNVGGTSSNAIGSSTTSDINTNGVSPGTFSGATAGTTPAVITPRSVATGVTSQAGVDPALAGQLTQYRALMLQEANFGSLANTNPSTSRRYLQVDRTTYQSRIGQ